MKKSLLITLLSIFMVAMPSFGALGGLKKIYDYCFPVIKKSSSGSSYIAGDNGMKLDLSDLDKNVLGPLLRTRLVPACAIAAVLARCAGRKDVAWILGTIPLWGVIGMFGIVTGSYTKIGMERPEATWIND